MLKQSPLDDADLMTRIGQCSHCDGLPLGPRPIVQFSAQSRILIAGQAPGRITHGKGIPFDDPSGNRLRDWLGVTRDQFYDPDLFAIVPMGFCFPGTGKGGDLPPRAECAPRWREEILTNLGQIELTLVIGKYAMDWHLAEKQGRTLTETVQKWRDFWPSTLPLPHPSPRNQRWLKKNPWFGAEVIPRVQARVQDICGKDVA